MRTIMFRGKRLDNGEWVYGYYIQYEHMGVVKCFIVTNWAQIYVNSFEVDPRTVGQHIGIHDKNKKPIYEHDCLEAYWPNGTSLREQTTVRWINSGQWNVSQNRIESRGHVVVGNIHEVTP